MAITAETEDRHGLTIHSARCDDCEHVLHATTEYNQLLRHLQRSQRPGWRPGLPIFCADQHACAERVWNRYGRYLQRLIGEQERTRQRVAGELRRAVKRGA